jgi:phosphatidylinositol alpha-1,6-mannosyltransferase
LRAHLAAIGHSHAVYDFAGMARAHPRIGPWRRPHLVCMHGIEAWEAATRHHLGRLEAADILLAFSRYSVERAARTHPSLSRARICWLATEQDDPPAFVGSPDRPTVLIVGRMEPGRPKGHDDLIAVWPKVASAVADARLVIVGRGRDEPRIRSLAAASPAAPGIEMRGFVPEEQTDRLFASASAFAMPSRGEGFGLVYIEAMRHGLPVIASTHDAASEITLDGVTGFNVDLDRRGDLAERLIALLRDTALQRRMGAAAAARWRQHFRYASFHERVRPVIADLIKL